MQPNNNIEQLRQNVKKQYYLINDLYCPYFNQIVKFSSDGFHHLLYKGSSKLRQRLNSEQFMRLKLFYLAPKLLKITTTVQEFHKENRAIVIKKNKRKEKILKVIKYWGFIAIIDNRKVKVIVKQVGEGHKRFWSIIPNWKTRRIKENHLRITYSGNLEVD